MPPPQITCPQAIEFRQLIQYKPLTKEQRGQILKAMDDYKEYLGKRETALDRLLPKDPRDESEKFTADFLGAKVSMGLCSVCHRVVILVAFKIKNIFATIKWLN